MNVLYRVTLNERVFTDNKILELNSTPRLSFHYFLDVTEHNQKQKM